MEATSQEKETKNLQDERTLEILKTIKAPQGSPETRLNQYQSRLKEIAQTQNCQSEELFGLAESHQLPFDVASEVMELSLLIQAHKLPS